MKKKSLEGITKAIEEEAEVFAIYHSKLTPKELGFAYSLLVHFLRVIQQTGVTMSVDASWYFWEVSRLFESYSDKLTPEESKTITDWFQARADKRRAAMPEYTSLMEVQDAIADAMGLTSDKKPDEPIKH